MWRDRALKIVLVLVGLLFTATVYPLVLFVKQESLQGTLWCEAGRDHSKRGDVRQQASRCRSGAWVSFECSSALR